MHSELHGSPLKKEGHSLYASPFSRVAGFTTTVESMNS